MVLDKELLDILACPEDKGPLLYSEKEEFLYNPRLRKLYRIKDGIPILLIDEAETISEEKHKQIMAEFNKADKSG
jgi:uncharacterized protein YbaR (Trm112 family)